MRHLLLIILSLLAFEAGAQNLLVNGGFEDENICTEYKHNCAPEAWIANSFYANYYYYTPGQAYKGTHFVGLASGTAYQKGVHNFIRTKLLSGLQPGHQYEIQFFVRSRHDILDSVGVYFTTTDFLYEKRRHNELSPQLWATDALDTLYEDPSLWQKVRLHYTATGNEQYITIGCFNRREYRFRGMPDFNRDYYFFLDEVTMKPLDPAEQLSAQADSVKAEIYNENERHEYLRRQIYVRSKTPPPPTILPITVMRIGLPPAPLQRIDTLVIPDIFFATASYQLTDRSHSTLDSFVNQLQGYTIDSIVVEGHTDSVGKLAYNEALSRNRAGAVKDRLAAGLAPKQLPFVARGYAYLKPIASNRTPAGRQQNRRVEIYVYRKEE
ncbi:OmpA family protein [Paraflavitalea pollutisoli]|uniref:OmpA family protein n=1 Tax=Paraflavitalea pollutisoli TaxID=3034143 RepID=UPI0023EC55A9|nr:OmpA family protein [Paraflavitalea sp. H1-2-19X]